MLNAIKNYFKKSIKKMAEENSKTFGNGKMDCCDLNKASNAVKKQNNSGK